MKAKLPRGTLEKLWSDPANWRCYAFYYCKSDPRIIVPKRNRWAGWTINCAHGSAWLTLFITIAYPVGMIIWLAKSPNAVWLIPALGVVPLIAVVFCRGKSATERYEEEG